MQSVRAGGIQVNSHTRKDITLLLRELINRIDLSRIKDLLLGLLPFWIIFSEGYFLNNNFHIYSS